MTASISTIPVWKKDSTAAEWLTELASMALEHPERWARVVVVYEKVNADGLSIETRNVSYNITSNTEIIGTLEGAKMEVFEYMKGRRP